MRRHQLHGKISQLAQFALLALFGLAVSIPFADEIYELLIKGAPDRILTYRANPFEIECSNPHTHHGYCPEIIVKRDSDPLDGGETFLHFIDQASVPVRHSSDIHERVNTTDAEVIFIGDSYIQAELIPYEQTLTTLLSEKVDKKMLRIGYNGWTVVTELGWLRTHPLRRGVEVNLFVAMDDFVPNNPFSNLRYHQIGTPIDGGGLRFPARAPASPLLATPAFSTAVFSPLFSDFAQAAIQSSPPRPIPKPFEARIDHEQSDCASIEQYGYVTPRTLDYVQFTYAPECWSADQFRNVRSVISDLRTIQKHVRGLGGKLRVFFAPPAWAFADEMQHGRMQSVYQIAPGASLSSQALARYVGEKMQREGIEFYSLEDKFREFKKTQKSHLFYPVDGHWTRTTHRAIADWFARDFYHR